MKKLLNEASHAELKTHAANLGLEVEDDATEDQLMDAIETSGMETEFIEVAEPAPVAAQKARAPKKAAAKKASPYAKMSLDKLAEIKIPIYLSEGKGHSGDKAAQIMVNGVLILIPREEEVEVKAKFVVAMMNAVEKRHKHNPETGKTETSDVKSHNTSLRGPDAVEIISLLTA